jgi:putative ABC transport system ATP-binding protein
VIEMAGVEYHGRSAGAVIPILTGVDLYVAAGEFVALCGPSGSGKTTLLNILGLLDVPAAGHYTLLGTDLARASDRARTRLRSQYLSFVFQAFHLSPELTVQQNVELGLMCQGVDRRTRTATARSVLDSVGLGHRLNARPGTLSGGEQQRTALARALARRSRLVLADEPTGNLDAVNAEAIMRLLGRACAQTAAVVMVTHDETLAARADRVIRLANGKVAAR